MKRRPRTALFLLALVCFAGVSAAHETWILFGTDLRHVYEPGLEWRSDFGTMTIAVVMADSR